LSWGRGWWGANGLRKKHLKNKGARVAGKKGRPKTDQAVRGCGGGEGEEGGVKIQNGTGQRTDGESIVCDKEEV